MTVLIRFLVIRCFDHIVSCTLYCGMIRCLEIAVCLRMDLRSARVTW